MGAYYLARGDYRRAISALTAIKTAGGSPAETANLLGVAQLMNGDPNAALASFGRALAADANFATARFNRAVAEMKLNLASAAASDLERVYAIASADLKARAAYHRALLAERNGDHSTALTWILRSTQADPNFDDAILYYGVILENSGSFTDAGQQYKNYLALHPDSIIARLRFGIAAQRAGFHDVAVRYLVEVTKLAPGTPEAAEANKILVMWE